MGHIRPIGPICLVLLSALAAANAADVAWDGVIRLTTNPASQVTGYSSQHGVAVDGAGNVHVAWLDQDTVPYQLRYRQYNAGTHVWLEETTLTTQQANCFRPGIACDSAGNLHLAWHVGNWNPLGVGIWAKRYNAGTHRWRLDTLIDSTSATNPQLYPSVACVPGTGDVAVAWYGSPDTGMSYQVFLRERHPATGWDSAMQVSQASTDHDQVSVAANKNGDLAVVWIGKDFGGNEFSQVYCRRRVGAAWQEVELVSDMPASPRQYSPCVAFDQAGALHVVWHGRSMMNIYQQVFHREYGQSGWSGIDSISGEKAYQQEYPSIACDAAGRCHAVWCTADSVHSQLLYGQRDTDGEWSSPMVLTSLDSGHVSYPSVACEADSGIHIVWHDDHSGNPDVYYLRGVLPGAGAVEERLDPRAASRVSSATIIRNRLALLHASSPRMRSWLMDVSGRKTALLHPGPNDVGLIPAGVYFIAGEHSSSRSTAVIIAR